jgi:hypothetical protein
MPSTAVGVATGVTTGSATGSVTGTGGPATTPYSTGQATVQAVCLATNNVLQYACTVNVTPPQPVDIAFWKTDGSGSTRTFSSESTSGSHEILLMLMEPDMDYDWIVTPRNSPAVNSAGSWHTDVLPDGAAAWGTPIGDSTVEMVLVQSPCVTGANVLIIGTDTGRVLYYQDLAFGTIDPIIDGTHWTEDETFLAIVGQDIVEKDIWGNELLHLNTGIHYTERVHHDVFRKNGLTLVLFAESVVWDTVSYDMDGFFVFDQYDKINEWHLFDYHQPPPGGLLIGRDYSHGNAVWMDDDYNAIMSLRHLSGIVSVFADPLDPLFGEVNWSLGGNPEDLDLASDFSMISSIGVDPTFRQQHNVHLMGDGRLALFDNQLGITPSRLLHISLDEVAGTADIDGAFDLPLHCDFQGGAWHTPAGNPFPTCAPMRTAYEFDLQDPVHIWEMQVQCATGFNTYTPRFTPWEAPEWLLHQNQ